MRNPHKHEEVQRQQGKTENIYYPYTFLAVQWLRVCLPMQGTRIQSQVQEDSMCLGTTKLQLLKHKRSHHSKKPEYLKEK